jgi:hypothetical protein
MAVIAQRLATGLGVALETVAADQVRGLSRTPSAVVVDALDDAAVEALATGVACPVCVVHAGAAVPVG